MVDDRAEAQAVAENKVFQKPLRTVHRKLLKSHAQKSADTVFRKQMFLEGRSNEMFTLPWFSLKFRLDHQHSQVGWSHSEAVSGLWRY